jgi:ATP-binding cassette subfamily B protein
MQSTRSREFHPDTEHQYNRSTPARWVLSHTLRYPLFVFLMIGASVINNIAFGNIQVYIGKSFDRIVAPGWVLADLLILVLVIVGSAVVQGVTGLARNYSVEFLAQAIERDTREEYYASLLEKSQTFHGRQRVGELMARATYDVHTLNMMFSPGIMLIIDSLLTWAVPMVMIGLIHPRLLLTPALFSIALILTVWEYNRRLKPVSLAQQDQYGKLSAGLEEAIAGIVAVKASVQENYEWKKFTGDARVFRDYYVKQGVIQARYWPLLVFALFWGAGLFHGLWLWRQGAISIGSVVGFLMLFNAFRFVTFISLFSFNMVQHGMASAGRILSVIKAATDLDQNLQGMRRPILGAVEFRNVSFAYNGNRVLCDVSFRMEPGLTVAIVGQTGSGKTTLTRLVNRIFDPDDGSVLVDKVDLRAWNLESLRSQIAAIEQDVFLFSQSIRENIAFGRTEVTQAEIEEAARQAQAHEFITGFAKGYDTVVGERGVMLSGGQKQRIAIARAFLTDPRILILDDSTSAIDSKTEDEIQKAMLRISRARTTFIITHRLSLIRRADRILVLRRGEIVDQGGHEELLERSPDYQRIFAGL